MLIALNEKVSFGKAALERKEKKISFVAMAEVPPYLLERERATQLFSAMYSLSSKFVMELSHAVNLYHSNPSLKPRDIIKLAKSYGKVDNITIEDPIEYQDALKTYKGHIPTKIDYQKVNIIKKITIEGYEEVYEGKYLNFP